MKTITLTPGRDGLYGNHWVFGLVKTVDDLYEPKIFGATADLRCECGEMEGEDKEGQICVKCFVMVVADSLRARKIRPARIELAAWCRHPLDLGQTITDFPIAPIAFRKTSDGDLTELGKLYEELIEESVTLRGRVETMAEEDRAIAGVLAEKAGWTNEVSDVLARIVGCGPAGAPDGEPAPGSLASLLPSLAAANDPGLLHVLYSMGYVLDVQLKL